MASATPDNYKNKMAPATSKDSKYKMVPTKSKDSKIKMTPTNSLVDNITSTTSNASETVAVEASPPAITSQPTSVAIPMEPNQQQPNLVESPTKSKLVAFLLSLFIGAYGADWF